MMLEITFKRDFPGIRLTTRAVRIQRHSRMRLIIDNLNLKFANKPNALAAHSADLEASSSSFIYIEEYILCEATRHKNKDY